MGTLEHRLMQIDRDRLVAYIENSNEPLFETKLLRAAFGSMDIYGMEPLELYRNHFALFYTLYKLQEYFYTGNRYLHVHFMRTRLLPYPTLGRCRFYNEQLSLFCNETAEDGTQYCIHHGNQTGDSDIETLSIKYFYFDEENYNRIDQSNAEAFLNGTWEILANFKEYEAGFKTLGLALGSDLSLVKQQFKMLAKQYHPDTGSDGGADGASEGASKFNEINNAYRLIMKMTPVFNKK